MTAEQLTARALATVHRADGWFITGGELDAGPYRTKVEANEDRRGLQRFYRNCHKRGFVTIEQRRAPEQATLFWQQLT
jgi:hypothetical protein